MGPWGCDGDADRGSGARRGTGPPRDDAARPVTGGRRGRGGTEDRARGFSGLPGERVTERKDGGVYVNGRKLGEPYLPTADTPTRPEASDVPPGCGRPADGDPGCVVPPGRVFVLGDNRTQS